MNHVVSPGEGARDGRRFMAGEMTMYDFVLAAQPVYEQEERERTEYERTGLTAEQRQALSSCDWYRDALGDEIRWDYDLLWEHGYRKMLVAVMRSVLGVDGFEDSEDFEDDPEHPGYVKHFPDPLAAHRARKWINKLLERRMSECLSECRMATAINLLNAARVTASADCIYGRSDDGWYPGSLFGDEVESVIGVPVGGHWIRPPVLGCAPEVGEWMACSLVCHPGRVIWARVIWARDDGPTSRLVGLVVDQP